MTDIDRDDYTWDNATKDLALTTPLTLRQAGDIVYPLRSTRLHPYDALPVLMRVVRVGCLHGPTCPCADVRLGKALADLLALAGVAS